MDLQKALQQLGFSDSDYIIEGNDFSMIPKFKTVVVRMEDDVPVTEEVDITPQKPTEDQLKAAYDEVLIKAEDLALLLDQFLKDKQRDPENDSFNIVDGLFHSFNFTHVSQPTYAELLSLKEITHSTINQNKINEEAENYLKNTDWMIIREAETGTMCPVEIKIARAQARARIVR